MAGTTERYGLLAECDTTADTLHAAEMVRDAGSRRRDLFTPFPVRGMDDAMGLPSSRVGCFTFCGGATGFTLGMVMICWMNADDYPIDVGGRPFFSPVYSFPVAY